MLSLATIVFVVLFLFQILSFPYLSTQVVIFWQIMAQISVLLNQAIKSCSRQSFDETKRKIAEIWECDDESISLDRLKISLLCPISKTRMTIPSRSRICSHLQCFDLSNFLEMTIKTPDWKCPICIKNACFENLIIDQFFMDLLKAVDKNVEDIELIQNGNWKVDGGTKSIKLGIKKDFEVITLDD